MALAMLPAVPADLPSLPSGPREPDRGGTTDAGGVSVVIRTRNEETALPATLEAIARQRFPGPVEVIIVDSGSTDDTCRLARDAGARVVDLGQAYRPGLASNTGLREARHPVCILLSAAAFPADDTWLPNLVAPLAGDATVAAAFSRQEPVPGASPIEEAFLARTFGSTRTTATFSATSAALRREVWERFPFDEGIASGGPDDRDWWARVTAAGHRVVYAGSSAVYRSHGLDLGGWFYRLREDARAEIAIAARAGRSTAPTGSAIGLALATVAHLARRRVWGELARYVVLAPVLAFARLQARRMTAPGGRVRVVDLLNRVDTRVFRPRERARRAVLGFLGAYWARPVPDALRHSPSPRA